MVTEPKKIGELLRAIDSYKGTPIAKSALMLAPFGVTDGDVCQRHDGISNWMFNCTVKNSVKNDGMPMEFIETLRKEETPKSFSDHGV